MIKRNRFPSAGWFVVFGSVACMGASLALAQRAVEPQRTPAATETQPRREAAGREAPGREAPGRETGAEPRTEPRDERGRADAREGGQAVAQTRRELGITFEGQDDLIVGSIAPDSTAADAGLRPRDRILSIDGRSITGQRRFMAFLSSLMGRRVPVVIEREGRQYTVQLMPGDQNERVAWLGVYLQDNEEGVRGARITQVFPGGPASRAGLRPGDTILSVNEQAIESAPDLIATVEQHKPQTKVNLRVMRGEQQLDAAVTLASRDSFIFHQASYDDDGDRRGRMPGRGSEDDEFSNIPPYAMQLEHDRRMAEQHERIETQLQKLQEEVRLLREALQRK